MFSFQVSTSISVGEYNTGVYLSVDIIKHKLKMEFNISLCVSIKLLVIH